MTKENQLTHAELITAVNKGEIDIQIATAKQYPRDLKKVIETIRAYATIDQETAEDCFYALKRGDTIIEGVSVRLAEIIANAWGNIRVQARVVSNDGKTIISQAICHDLETNVAVSIEVSRRITDRNGKTYSEDMQVTTGNAASSIAFRNSVLKVVPKAITSKILNEIKDIAMGKSLEVEKSRQKMFDYFGKLGIKQDQLMVYLEVNNISDIQTEHIFHLRSLANAIKEGTTTVAEAFASNKTDNSNLFN